MELAASRGFGARPPAPQPQALERICVFCGASAGEDPRYLDAASEMGLLLAEQDIELVYGGSRMGLMGRLADAVLHAGGRVTGVIPGAMMPREVAHPGLTDLRIVRSMHERKTEMFELADAFVALPGGLGTLEEFCEILTWAQLGLHAKPCGLLDTAGFWQPLIRFFDHAVRAGFLGRSHRDMIVVETAPAALLERVRSYQAPQMPRWLEQSET